MSQDNRMIQITDKDIERVERLFFPNGGNFKDDKNERYTFIKCLDRSVSVHACPGSGKTTCLLAKLFLLSEKMSFEDGSGICVLTHTNVAMNEIKDKLGNKADRLFQYPNFFGTIQSFADRYLAIPCYCRRYRKRPQFIDTEIQKQRMLKTYYLKDVDNKILNSLKSYHYSCESFGNDFFGNYTITKGDAGEFELIKSKTKEPIKLRKLNSKNDWSSDEKKQIIEAAIKLKGKIIKEEAVLSFEDAYDFSFIYLSQNPKLKASFSSRFKFAFIDEMQDTNLHQKKLLEAIFDNTVIVQCLGDLNQSILADNELDSSWKKESGFMEITGSKRFSQPIANLLRCAAIEPQNQLTGLDHINIPIYIITYDSQTQQDVLEKFVELIKMYELDKKSKETKRPIKAVGWIGKKKEGLTIACYFKGFCKEHKSKKATFPNLITLLSLSKNITPKEFKNNIINAILEILYLGEIKNQSCGNLRYYSKTSLIDFINKSSDELLLSLYANIAKWYQSLATIELAELHSKIAEFFLTNIYPSLKVTLNPKATDYIKKNQIEEISVEQANAGNKYQSKNPELKDIEVQIGTVHSVKGETHTATLYLETKYYKTCGYHLMEQLCGTPYSCSGKNRNTHRDKCMKVAHVGFSRPTDLLCVALEKSLVDKNRDKLKGFGWEII